MLDAATNLIRRLRHVQDGSPAISPGSGRSCWLVDIQPDRLHLRLLPIDTDRNATARLASDIAMSQ